MGLFQKKIIPITTPKYSLGHQETMLIIGLGNIGREYDDTRHNVGFECIDAYAKTEQFNPWVVKKELKSELCAKIVGGKKVILCKPQTFMNLSGEAVQAVQKFYKITDTQTLVVYDELDIDLGKVRTGQGGQSAGHNGIKSLIAHTQNEFWRIRIGIGPKSPEQIDSADFVLQKFSSDQTKTASLAVKESTSIINDWLTTSHIETTTISVS